MHTKNQCLIITDADDQHYGHVPLIMQHMSPKHIVVIDPIPAILDGAGLTYRLDKNGTTFIYNGRPLTRVKAVWDRRPTPLRREMLDHIDPRTIEYASVAIRRHTYNFYSMFPDALWVSDDHAVQRAENKALQLQEAAKLGFAVPATIFTSNPQAAKQFVARNKATIIKTPSTQGPIVDDKMFYFFSTRVTPATPVNYSGLHLAPAIFQVAIDVDYDLRITVVGEEIFAASIVADAEKSLSIGVRDWRIGNYTGLDIIPYSLPKSIATKCITLVKKLGLQFGAIDIIRDKKGIYWFVEINPNGQWGFVEHLTKQPISQAIARLLQSRM